MLALGFVILSVIGGLFLAMTLIWLTSIAISNPTIVDVWWSSGMALSMAIYLLASSQQLWSIVLSGMFLFWALRLTLFILITRICKSHTDERYAKMESNWKNQQGDQNQQGEPNMMPIYRKRFVAFQFQTFMQLLLLIPLIVSTYDIEQPENDKNSLNAGAIVFAVLQVLSVLGQWVTDYQVYAFAQKQIAIRKENPNAPRLICKTGLWSYSRHPNYFFEMTIWISFVGYIYSIIIPLFDDNYNLEGNKALAVSQLIVPVLPVIIMFVIFRYITGPITEGASLKKRPVLYKEYIENVPMIFPFIKWPNFVSNMEVLV